MAEFCFVPSALSTCDAPTNRIRLKINVIALVLVFISESITLINAVLCFLLI